MKIFKYIAPIQANFTLDLPKGAEILAFQIQHGAPCIWALVAPDAEKETRTFSIVGTGYPVEFTGTYIGTAQQAGGQLVWHLFEVEL